MLHRIASSLLRPYTRHLDRRLDELRDQLMRLEHNQSEWIRNLGQWAHEEGVRTKNIEGTCGAIRGEVSTAALTMTETSTYLDRVAAEFAAGGPVFAAISAESALAPFAFASAGRIEPGTQVVVLGTSPAVAAGFAALGARVRVVSALAPFRVTPGTEVIPQAPSAWAGPVTPCVIACWLDGSAAPDALGRLAAWVRPGGCVLLLVPATPSPDATAGWRVTSTIGFRRAGDGAWQRTDDTAAGTLTVLHAVREG
jgi:hypothetical protein